MWPWNPPAAVALAEVRVRAPSGRRRTHQLGSRDTASNTTYTLRRHDLGGQMGTVIKLSRRPTRVLDVNFNIAHSAPGQIVLRVNIRRSRGKDIDAACGQLAVKAEKTAT